MSDYRITRNADKANIYTPYNKDFVARIKVMGGRWDGSKKCWTVNAEIIDDVRKAMRKIYGRDDTSNCETVSVQLTFGKTVYGPRESITLFGKTLASAFGRDSGARIGDDVIFLSGAPRSGGSVKNWDTVIDAGCVVKLINVPKAIVNADALPDGVEMEIINVAPDRAALLAEKESLLARLAEIEKLLDQLHMATPEEIAEYGSYPSGSPAATYVVRDREAGNVIERVSSIEEGEALIAEYEEADRRDGTYTPDFYEVAEI